MLARKKSEKFALNKKLTENNYLMNYINTKTTVTELHNYIYSVKL